MKYVIPKPSSASMLTAESEVWIMMVVKFQGFVTRDWCARKEKGLVVLADRNAF